MALKIRLEFAGESHQAISRRWKPVAPPFFDKNLGRSSDTGSDEFMLKLLA
jgi:hypothetical protein